MTLPRAGTRLVWAQVVQVGAGVVDTVEVGGVGGVELAGVLATGAGSITTVGAKVLSPPPLVATWTTACGEPSVA